MTKIGLSSDLFDTKGRPVFDPSAFDLFTEAGLSWTVLPPDGGTIDPTSVAEYDALFIGGCDRPDARDLPEVFDLVSSRDGSIWLRDGDDWT